MAKHRASLAESFAGADLEADAERLRSLRQMKAVALGFLLGATGDSWPADGARPTAARPGWDTSEPRPRPVWSVRWRTGLR